MYQDFKIAFLILGLMSVSDTDRRVKPAPVKPPVDLSQVTDTLERDFKQINDSALVLLGEE